MQFDARLHFLIRLPRPSTSQCRKPGGRRPPRRFPHAGSFRFGCRRSQNAERISRPDLRMSIAHDTPTIILASKAGRAAAGHFEFERSSQRQIREGTDCRPDDPAVRDHEEVVIGLRIYFSQRGHHAGLELVKRFAARRSNHYEIVHPRRERNGDPGFGSRPKSDFPTRRNSPPARSHQAPGECPAWLRLLPPKSGSAANRWILLGPARRARLFRAMRSMAARPSAERATSVCPTHCLPLDAVAGWRKRRSNIFLNVR